MHFLALSSFFTSSADHYTLQIIGTQGLANDYLFEQVGSFLGTCINRPMQEKEKEMDSGSGDMFRIVTTELVLFWFVSSSILEFDRTIVIYKSTFLLV